MSWDGLQVPGSNQEITREVTNGNLFISPSSFIYSRLIAGIRAKMKDETTYLQTYTMAYEIFNHAHRFSMAKQLTTTVLRIQTCLPFADNI